jgi:hypothetical protein
MMNKETFSHYVLTSENVVNSDDISHEQNIVFYFLKHLVIIYTFVVNRV